MRRPAGTWVRLGIALVAIGLPSSCLLTSSFDGLTSDPDAPDAATSQVSASSSSSGQGGADGSTTTASGTGGGAPFPDTKVLDDFDRPDGALGNGWLLDSPTTAAIGNHQLVRNAGADGVILWPLPFGADQEAFITFEKTHDTDFEIELILKSQANGGECEALQLAYHPPQLLLYWCSGSDGDQLGQGVTTAFAPGDQLGARAFADGTVQAFKNGALLATWDATPWKDHDKPGRIGLGTYGLTGPNAFDDFGGGTLAP